MRALRLLLAALVIAMAAPSTASAYSYAAAGKEPLLDAREAILGALTAGDWAKVDAAVSAVDEEFGYLSAHEAPGLNTAMSEAIAAHDAAAVAAQLHRALVAEIERRLDGAAQNLDDYQTAKVLVVKSKRFLDAIAGDLSPDARKAAEAGMSDALEAIGNPGVFGVGQKPADPEAFAAARKATLAALEP